MLHESVFDDGDPDPERYLFKNGSVPQTAEQTGALVRWLMDGAGEGALRPFLLVDQKEECVGLAWLG